MIMACAGLLASAPAVARADLKYYPDPVYKKLNDEDTIPMAEILEMAGAGDVRAQFIIGDLYAKGKGGLAQDLAEARRWFEKSAIHGYNHSLIRLAALAKRENKPVEAWQWYTLAIRNFDYGPERKFASGARQAVAETAQLSAADIRQAKKFLSAWENMRDRMLEDEKKAALEQQDKKTAIAGVVADEQN